jgi:ADP-ribose pyrophosphatase YjhB (NUDIX family)
MVEIVEGYDYDGVLVVVEFRENEIVFIHPAGGTAEAPGSLPSDPCAQGESPEMAAIRIVKEKTGLNVALDREFVTFIQHGTPTGTMRAHGYVAHVISGELLNSGPEGAVRAYRIGELPAVVPVRVANQRVLSAYLAQRE